MAAPAALTPPVVGVVGCGAIGQALVRAALGQGPHRLRAPLCGVASRSPGKARAFLAGLPGAPPFLPVEELVRRAQLVVEAAGQEAVPGLAELAFGAGKDLLVISVGALLEHPRILEQARATGCRLIVPSGAIAGLDGIKAACRGAVSRVTLTTRKPPGGLAGAPYLVQRGISLEGISEERLVYEGPVREACRGFPENVNVAAAVSLAGLGADRTTIRILAVPGLRRNCHTVEVEGDFGRLTVQIENVPTENPKTGRLTILSILRAIDDAADPVRLG